VDSPQGLNFKAFQNAKGKNKLKCQKALQSDWHRKDHTPEIFQTSHPDKKIKEKKTQSEKRRRSCTISSSLRKTPVENEIVNSQE
jgi:hypothetical protein